jgi:phage repressor protein C with HTH and peptisase S24 domain
MAADTEMAARLVAARKPKYASPGEAADALGVERPTYWGHENGSRGFSRSAERYADFFKVSLEWLLTGKGQMYARLSDAISVPLVSPVTAGKLESRQGIRPADVEQFISMSGLGPGDWIAMHVEGSSMDRVAPDGSIIFVNRSQTQPADGKPFIFASADEDEATFKLYSDHFLMPFSFDPMHRPIPIPQSGVRIIGRVRKVFIDV